MNGFRHKTWMADDIFDTIKLQFEKFLSLVGNVLAHDKEIEKIQNKLRRCFNTASSSYLCSTDFQLFFNHIYNRFKDNMKSTKYFTLLSSLNSQLKRHCLTRSGLQKSSSDKDPIVSVKSTEETMISNSSSPHTKTSDTPRTDHRVEPCPNIFVELTQCHLSTTTKDSEITVAAVITSEKDKKLEKKIRKLERRLSSLSKTIRELETKDMSLDEMEHCDLYVVEANLKKQAYEVYTKLTELRKEPTALQRILDQPVILSEIEIGYPLINRALQDMVNQTKFLPSFHEVLNTVQQTNEKYDLELSIDIQKSVAEKSFKIIGNKVKSRRMADFNDIMTSRLPEDFDIEANDPASSNEEIEQILLENERKALMKTEKILEEFSQIDPDLQSDVSKESCEESEHEESDEEEHADVNNELPDEVQYDIVDILPPFSPETFSSPASPTIDTTTYDAHLLETIPEIPLNGRALTILSTASIPLTRAGYHPFRSNSGPEIYTIHDENETDAKHAVQTLVPRRRHATTVNETLYNLYQQRLDHVTSSVSRKRRASKDIESSPTKRMTEPPDIVTLD